MNEKREILKPVIETRAEKIEKAAQRGDRFAQSIKSAKEILSQNLETIFDDDIDSKPIPDIMRELKKAMHGYWAAIHDIQRIILERRRGNKNHR